MACCGQKRNEYQQQVNQQPVGSAYNHISSHKREDIRFEYTGKTALTVMGAVTAKRYRFTHNGDVQLIDYKDASSMMAIAVLKKITDTA